MAHCVQTASDSATGLRPGIATLKGAPLVFAHASPDARVLAGVQCPGDAFRRPRASIADQFRVSDLRESGAAVPYREEQLRVLVTTDRLVAPIHTLLLLTECAARHTAIFSSAVKRAQEKSPCPYTNFCMQPSDFFTGSTEVNSVEVPRGVFHFRDFLAEPSIRCTTLARRM